MNRLRQIRDQRGFSQKFIALTLGVKAPSVSNWEHGKTEPTPENYAQLASLYGVSVDYLMGRTDDPTPEKSAQSFFLHTGKTRLNAPRIASDFRLINPN